MPESLHALLQATRDDIRADMAAIRRELAESRHESREDIAAMRREQAASRRETANLATQVAQLAAEAVATRRELEHHRDDDRRQQAQIDALRTWRAWIAGGMAVLMLLVTGLALPLLVGRLT